MQTGVIYRAYCIPSGKSYIGQSVDFADRKRAHLQAVRAGSETHFHCALRKHEGEAFVWSLLAEGIPTTQLDTHERFWIRFCDSYKRGYNSTPGGIANRPSDEVRAKMSAAQQRPEVRAIKSEKMSEAMLAMAERGEHPSQRPEVRAKQRETQRLAAARGEHHTQTDEVRAKMSAGVRAHRDAIETLEKGFLFEIDIDYQIADVRALLPSELADTIICNW